LLFLNLLLEKKTNPQIKSVLRDTFLPYGAVDEIQINPKGDDKEITVLFARLLEKGKNLQTALTNSEKPTISVYDTSIEVAINAEAEVSGGGKSTGTAHRKSDKPARGRGRGGRGGSDSTRGGKDGKDSKDSKDGKDAKKDDKKKDDKKGGDKKDDKKGGDKKDDKKGGDKKADDKKGGDKKGGDKKAAAPAAGGDKKAKK